MLFNWPFSRKNSYFLTFSVSQFTRDVNLKVYGFANAYYDMYVHFALMEKNGT